MNALFDWGIELIVRLQQAAPWLKGSMLFFSFLGTEDFFFIFLPLLYWCVDVGLGIRVGIILGLSDTLKTSLKLVFHQPRPYWISDQVKALSTETSYGLPSGHAQNAMSIWGIFGAHVRGWLRWLMIALIFLIGFSRIFLAVHFPTDVLAGWLIGGLLLWAFIKWEKPVLGWFKQHTLTQKIALAFLASLLMIGVAFIGLAFVPSADPSAWEQTAALAAPPEPGESAINPRDMNGAVGVAGSFFGFVAGVILLFHQGDFSIKSEWWKRVARFAVGIVGVLILWMGLRAILPRDATLAAQVLRYLRYTLTGWWIAYGAPWVFLKLKL